MIMADKYKYAMGGGGGNNVVYNAKCEVDDLFLLFFFFLLDKNRKLSFKMLVIQYMFLRMNRGNRHNILNLLY